MTEERNEWKEALVERLIVLHIYSDKHEKDPRQALNDIIAWEVTVALDPLVSSAAVDLIEKHKGKV